MEEFQDELAQLINKHSMENGSDTPDFMLAEFLVECLKVFNNTVMARRKWYGESIKSETTITKEKVNKEGHNGK